MRKHLVKRNPDLSGTKIRFTGKETVWFIQTRKNGSPSGSKAKMGEHIYLYETGYAVWAEGTVGEVREPIRIHSVEEAVAHAKESSFGNTKYWGRLIIEEIYPYFKTQDPADGKFFSVLEVQANMEAMAQPVPLDPKLFGQNSWRYLDEPIQKFEKNLKLDENIPSALRLKIFDLCSLDADTAYYDIDHFVPKSVGGPGNIIENLQPIGSSINRTKGDKVPSALFALAKEIGILKTLGISRKLPEKPRFFSDGVARSDARKITSYIALHLSLSDAREFYAEVRRRHRKAIDKILR